MLRQVIIVAIAFIGSLNTILAQDSTKNKIVIKMEKVSFKNNNGITIVGNLHYPVEFKKDKKYSAIISVGPASGAKEQTAGLYAIKLAEQGFITLAIDASFQGESGGEPRYKEDPMARVEDIRGAVDFLSGLSNVEASQIGVLGICAGGGYAASAAMTERRIKAVGAVVPVNGGTENRAGGQKATIEMLEGIAKQRTLEAKNGEPMIIQWIPDEYKNAEDIDLKEAYDYYRTPRGSHPNWPNKMRFVCLDAVIAFDAFYLSEMLLTQPLQVITGSKIGAFGSKRDGKALFDKAASQHKDLMVMDGASHFDLYDNPKYVDEAIQKLVKFYITYLK